MASVTEKNRLKIKVIKPALKPEVCTEGSAGLDLKIDRPVSLPRGGSITGVGTGIAVEIPKGYVGLISPRSSAGIKHRLELLNSTGIIDSDYRGEITLSFRNVDGEHFFAHDGTRLFQMVVVPHLDLQNAIFVEKLSDTSRGEGGIGSTGNS